MVKQIASIVDNLKNSRFDNLLCMLQSLYVNTTAIVYSSQKKIKVLLKFV